MRVTEEAQWRPPGDGPQHAGEHVPPIAPPPRPVAPTFPPLAPGYRPPPPPPATVGNQWAGSGEGQPGWTPPPKPGLIPLRPLDLGTILGASFRVLRRNPRPTFGAALLIQGMVALLSLGVIGFATFTAISRISSSTSQNTNQITAGAFGLIVLAAIIPVFVSIAASALLQGVIVLEVSRGAIGEKSTFGELWRRARGRIGALIGWTLLLILAVALAAGIFIGIIVALVSTAAGAGIVLAALFGIFGALGAVVLFFWLGTKLSLVSSALMIERLSLGRAIARSWSLTEGAFWRTLGIQLLVSAIISVVSQVISAPLSFLAPLLNKLLDPNLQNGPTTVIVTVGLGLLALIISVVFGAIAAVVQTATTALIYLDRRIRKEGLDLELAHFVEARQAGDASVPDPLLNASAGHFPPPGEPDPTSDSSPRS